MSNTWAAEGHRSAASWLAQKQKSSLGDAFCALETSERISGLEQTTKALKNGELSLHQAKEVSAAARRDPSSEKGLLADAQKVTLKDLKAKAREVLTRTSTKEEELARYRAIRDSRYLRHYTDRDGAFRLEARLAPDDGARVASAIAARTNLVFDEMRKAGQRESPGAYSADALVALVCAQGSKKTGPGGSSRTDTVVVRVDAKALKRGHAEGAETCEIRGVGRVPVAAVERILPEAFVKVVVVDSVDVLSVCHLGRNRPSHLESALEERDRSCVVPNCDVSLGLQTHHWRVDYSKSKTSSLDGLARVCKAHHDLMSYEGFKLTGGPGAWELKGPGTEYRDTG